MRLPEGIGREDIGRDRPVLIAGPTASGKSALALAIAETLGGVVVNADALQVFAAWPVLTAQPGPADRARAPHALYGHLPFDAAYSAGDWLREVAPLLAGPERPIIVGGTGLYFLALTEGLAEIPAVPHEVRAEADRRMARDGVAALAAALDPATRARIDLSNPARVQRAWEVLRATGRGLADWQADTPPPLLPTGRAHALLIEASKAWLDPRIAARFDAMLAAGALDEARAERARWSPARQSSKAIGAAELIAHLDGRMTLAEARAAAILATRQYAKRQRTWFRSRMKGWARVDPQHLA
ncbi:MAG: tRNA (adenosine(37)-N6)-dimethylallyltransferase MiaA [Rhodobacteraceae bacterium]|nr:tRNA (adenosine(37)-N6)-dimethylallyltransferase MiaA [Paracoccaceae bacterium]